MRRALGNSSFAVAATAWGGVVAGHVLAYAIAYPRPEMRHEQLAMTGHGSLHGLMLLAA